MKPQEMDRTHEEKKVYAKIGVCEKDVDDRG
jgi:hypothetical protein